MGVGEPAPNAGYSGGNRPQRGIRKGCRGLLWAIVGEPVPNAGYSQGL